MVVSKKEKSQSSKDEKSTSKTSTSSTSMSKTTTTSTSKSTSEKSGSHSSQQAAQKSNVVISEVASSGSLDDGNVRSIQTQYVVTQPEHVPQAQKSKEHYIFGGTKIVEMGTTMGSDLISREKNQSAWNGQFVYESTPQRTVLKTWTKQETTAEPSTSTTKTTTTTEDFAKTNSNLIGSSSKNITTESSKLVSDTMKKQTETSVGKMFVPKTSKDVTDATDRLLESERCITKKAYVTTDNTDENINQSSSTSKTTNIESQILANKSLFEDTKSTASKKVNTTSDTISSDRYPVTMLPQRSSNLHETTHINSDNTVHTSGDKSKLTTTEQYSQSYSTSSRNEKSSASNKVVEIIDGKEKVISDKFNESGSMQSKHSQEQFRSKSDNGSKPFVEYHQNLGEENISYKTDNRDKEPIYDRNYRDAQRSVKQIGDKTPIEYTKGSYETTHYDDKTKKYVTDIRQHENNRQLESNIKFSDSIQSKYDIGTLKLNIDNNRNTSNTNQLTNVQTSTTTGDAIDRFNTSRMHSNDLSTSNDFRSSINNTTSTASNSNNVIDSKSTAYTSKVFDSKTNTWKVVDDSKSSEINTSSTTSHKPYDIGRRSPTKSTPTDSKHTSQTNLSKDKRTTSTASIDKSSTKDVRSKTDRKSTVNDSKTTIDKISRTDTNTSMTKTIDKKISQHLYDEKTKTWREVDEKTIKSKRPSLIRYISKDHDGKYTTIYKRKLFDKRSGSWKVVDEKVYRNNNFNEHIPEVMEDVTNVTTTTYTTKVFDTNTNTWRIVDEQTFSDRNTQVPKDIADEIARDQPDIANITTTTELTKVSDQSKKIYK